VTLRMRVAWMLLAVPAPVVAQSATDWPNLQRYRDANAALPAPAAGENRVVFMGNSITEGWQKYFGDQFRGKPYVNRGIGGQTTPQMLVRFRQDVIALKPKVVVILAGTNDIAGNTGQPGGHDGIGHGPSHSRSLMLRATGVRLPVAARARAGTEDRSIERVDAAIRRFDRERVRRLSRRDGGRAAGNARRAGD